jgi:paraquat-inducible protein A
MSSICFARRMEVSPVQNTALGSFSVVCRTCSDCSAPYRSRALRPGQRLQCSRCGARLAVGRRSASLQTPLALALTGMILLVLSNVSPVMTFDVAGSTQSNLIITGVMGLVHQGYGAIALLVFFCVIGSPAIYLVLISYTLTAGALRVAWPGVATAWRWILAVEPWSLVPIFGVSCAVAVVRLDLLGTVAWDNGVVFVVLLSLCCLLLRRIIDRPRIELILEELT